jgi:alkyl hydroperoxide reductase subunit AhpC
LPPSPFFWERVPVSIQIGRPAPGFSAEAYVRGAAQPQQITLEELRGSWVVLFFYPRDFTFVCPTEIQAFAAVHDEFLGEDAVLIAASTDSYYTHAAWYALDVRIGAAAFPVLADTSHEISAAYGVLQADGSALRGTFIIDPQGIVRHVQLNDADVGRDPQETLRVLRALRTGGMCPASWRPGDATLRDIPEAA